MIEFRTKEEERDFTNFYEYYKLYQDSLVMSEMPFLDSKDQNLHEIAIIHHQLPDALKELFYKVGVNSRNKIAILYNEDDAFIGLKKEKRDLVLVTNVDYLSPSLFMRALGILEYHLTNYKANPEDRHYFASDVEHFFIVSGLNVKVLTNVKEDDEVNKTEELKIEFLPLEKCHHYMQRFKGSSLRDLINRLMNFNLELALPIVFINAEHSSDSKSIIPYDQLTELKEKEPYKDYDYFPTYRIGDKIYTVKGKTIEANGKRKVVPMYDIKENGFLVPTEEEFLELIKSQKPFEQELLKYIASITGYFIPCFYVGRICAIDYERLKYSYDRNIDYESGSKHDITNSEEIKEFLSRLKSHNKGEQRIDKELKL